MSPNLPLRLALAFISPKLNTWYIREVCMGCLHVENPNPSGHYIQYPDFMVEWEDGQLGVEVSFSKLSASFTRSGMDFHRARVKIAERFTQIIQTNLPREKTCTLFVGSQTDKAIEGIDGSMTTLHETDYIKIQGIAEPHSDLDVRADALLFKLLKFRGGVPNLSHSDLVRSGIFVGERDN